MPFDIELNWKELLPQAPTQQVYNLLIAAKNDWNARIARGETCGPGDGPEKPMKKAYLHFSITGVSSCACGYPSLPGTHAEFACTIIKSVVK